MDDDLGINGSIVVGLQHGADIVVLNQLGLFQVEPCKKHHDSPNFIWGAWKHVQIVKRTIICKTAYITVANHFVISFVPRNRNII